MILTFAIPVIASKHVQFLSVTVRYHWYVACPTSGSTTVTSQTWQKKSIEETRLLADHFYKRSSQEEGSYCSVTSVLSVRVFVYETSFPVHLQRVWSRSTARAYSDSTDTLHQPRYECEEFSFRSVRSSAVSSPSAHGSLCYN